MTNEKIADLIANHNNLISGTVRKTCNRAGFHSENFIADVEADVVMVLIERDVMELWDGRGTRAGYVAMITRRETQKIISKAENHRHDSLNVHGLLTGSLDDSESGSGEQAGKELPLGQSPQPDHLFFRKLEVERIRSAMERLNRAERAVLRGMMADWPMKKIGSLMGRDPVQMTRLKTRALKSLRKAL